MAGEGDILKRLKALALFDKLHHRTRPIRQVGVFLHDVARPQRLHDALARL